MDVLIRLDLVLICALHRYLVARRGAVMREEFEVRNAEITAPNELTCASRAACSLGLVPILLVRNKNER